MTPPNFTRRLLLRCVVLMVLLFLALRIVTPAHPFVDQLAAAGLTMLFAFVVAYFFERQRRQERQRPEKSNGS